MKKIALVTCLASLLCSSAVMAGDDDILYGSLTWNLGSGARPDLTVGYRSVEVDCCQDVKGWQTSMSYKPGHGFHKWKVEGVRGDTDRQYTLGGGYNLQQHRWMATGGVTSNHVTAGVDYMLGSHQFDPYIGLTTLDDY